MIPTWCQWDLPFQLLLAIALGCLWVAGRLHSFEFVLVVLAQTAFGIVAGALWLWKLDGGTPRTSGAWIAEFLARTIMVLLSLPAGFFLAGWALDLARS